MAIMISIILIIGGLQVVFGTTYLFPSTDAEDILCKVIRILLDNHQDFVKEKSFMLDKIMDQE
jgi:hypothetical protein